MSSMGGMKLLCFAGCVSLMCVPALAQVQQFNTNYEPRGIAAGSDGALWFAGNQEPSLGRVTTAGSVSNLPLPAGDSTLGDIVAGPDGALWFTMLVGSSREIGRMTTAGTVTLTVPVSTAT